MTIFNTAVLKVGNQSVSAVYLAGVNLINTDEAPSITGVPAISGTLGVGNLLTASPASVSGSPLPTRSWSWERDGFPISDATGNTYLQAEADEGADVTVVQIETNSVGSDSAESYAVSVPLQPVVNRAAVVVLLGQSLNAPRGTTVQASGGTLGFAKMPVGGSSITNWDFYASNATHTGHWNELATAINYTENTLQTPGAGIAQQLEGGRYSRAYIGNVAIGARDLQTLMLTGPTANAWATIFRLCEIARADGYVPEVMFYSAHGEANSASNTSEIAYYDFAVEYYGRLQLYAAQAMRTPAYVAPVLLTYPAQQAQATVNTGEQDRNIKEAIRRLCIDQAGFYDAGAIYQWPFEADRVHPMVGSYVLRGEHIGRMLRLITLGTPPPAPLSIVNASLSGSTFTLTFSKPVVRDASLNLGQNLATATAEDGIEWFDNGTAIAINAGSLIYSGNTVVGTLASVPVGALGQQVVRIAEQYTPGTLVSGQNNLAGSVVRSDQASWTANYLNTVSYDYAIPQRIVGVS